MFLKQFCFVICLSICSICAPIQKNKHPLLPSSKVLNFMKYYGYIEEDDGTSEALYSETGISDIIKTVQKFGGIEETGEIDNATFKLMTSRRCGVPDIIRHKRQKRYILGPQSWQKRNLSYFVSNWPPNLGEHTIIKSIQKALDTWGAYGRLYFNRSPTQDADIIVAFRSGYHGDIYPFDGPGNVLAHAFFPNEGDPEAGDIHFDADETWIDQSQNNSAYGTDFFTVALHELGHSLGLAHSPVTTAVMFPYYRDYDPNFQLDYDDILAMYNFYIVRRLKSDDDTPPPTVDGDTNNPDEYTTDRREEYTTDSYNAPDTAKPWYSPSTPEYTSEYATTTATDVISSASTETIFTYEGDTETVDDHKEHDAKHNIPTPSSPSFPNICDGFVDAVATLRDELFIFKNQYIWRYKEKGRLEPGYPIPLSQMFPKLPDTIKKIDSAYERADGMIVIFTGKTFWVFDGTNFIENSPRLLTDYGLPDYLDSIDAVQTWGRNKKTYFYKNDRFWRYNETAKAMDMFYPQHIGRWRGIPENIDAATTWKDGFTYFFKDDIFWRFDNNWVIASQDYPLPTAQIWFGCPEEEHKMIRLLRYFHSMNSDGDD